MNYFPNPYANFYPDLHHYYSYFPPPPIPYQIQQWYQNPQQFLPQQQPLKAQESIQKNQSSTIKQQKIQLDDLDQQQEDNSQIIVVDQKKEKKKKNIIKKQNINKSNIYKNCNFQNMKQQQIQRRKKEINFLANLKKNTQSNIVNQIFSYIGCKVKSGQCVHTLFNKDVFKIKSFYDFIKTIKKRKKKYINRKFLLDLCILDQKTHAGYKLFLRQKGYRNSLKRQQLKAVLRKLFVFYLNSQCILSIATSKKLSPEAWQEHLYRRRQILTYLEQNIRENQNNLV